MQETQRWGFDAWVRKTPWRRAWQPTPVFLPRESRGQRHLVGYNPWGQRVGLKRLSMHTHSVMVLGGGTYGRRQSQSSYYREPESTVPLLQGRAPQEDCCYKPGGERSPDSESASTLNLDFLASKTVRNTCLLRDVACDSFVIAA